MPKSQSCLQIQLPKRPYRPEQRSTQASQHASSKIGIVVLAQFFALRICVMGSSRC